MLIDNTSQKNIQQFKPSCQQYGHRFSDYSLLSSIDTLVEN